MRAKRCVLPCVRRSSSSSSSNSNGSSANEQSDRGDMLVRAADNALDVRQFDVRAVRNFSIISHVDHGKTTLSQRVLQLAGSIPKDQAGTGGSALFLDQLQVERERGITVHASTASLTYKGRLLNLVDTPGHVDFKWEVSRALKACEGALLLVDATKGVQAQTISNFWLAFAANLTIIPVINKVDLDHADVPNTLRQLRETFEIVPEDVIHISAKEGRNVDKVMDAILERIPAPQGNRDAPLQALLFDSWYDRHVGVVMLWRVMHGRVVPGMRIKSLHSKREYMVQDVGLLFPSPRKATALYAGQVGYVVAGMKTAPEAFAGDTFADAEDPAPVALEGFQGPRSVVFAGLFATSQDDTAALADAMEKIYLTDNSIVFRKETSLALGTGFRCGFLGVLHMDVFIQRLSQEFGVEVVATAPTVPYRVTMANKSVVVCNNPSEFPDPGLYIQVEEPVVDAVIVVPNSYIGSVMTLCQKRRGTQLSVEPLGEGSTILRYRMPLADTITGFFDKLKELTSGFASFEYDPSGYQPCDLVKVEILLNGKPADPLATLCHRTIAREWGVKLTQRLREVIHRQQFEVAIQASIGSKVIARERVPQLRKNVTGKCYGGDQTRKKKLLEKQKEGKKKMRTLGTVELSQDAFFSVLQDKD